MLTVETMAGHEAGHALYGWGLGVNVYAIWLDPALGGATLLDEDGLAKLPPEDAAALAAAGDAGERRLEYAGYHNRQELKDLAAAVRSLPRKMLPTGDKYTDGVNRMVIRNVRSRYKSGYVSDAGVITKLIEGNEERAAAYVAWARGYRKADAYLTQYRRYWLELTRAILESPVLDGIRIHEILREVPWTPLTPLPSCSPSSAAG